MNNQMEMKRRAALIQEAINGLHDYEALGLLATTQHMIAYLLIERQKRGAGK